MTVNLNSETTLIKDFSASEQISLFQRLKQEHFSGQLHIQEINQPKKWVFFLYVGRILYGTGGLHSVRRWRRNLVCHLPQIASQLQQELESIDPQIFKQVAITWDYQLLKFWVEQGKIEREKATKVIGAGITETLFDISQVGQIRYFLKPQKNLNSQQLAMIDSEQQIVEAWKLWQKWQEANLADISPDLAPVIIKPEQLQTNTSEKTYGVMSRLLNGKHSLRDLAVQKKTNPLTVVRSIAPYLQLGLLELVEVSDILLPFALPNNDSTTESNIQEFCSLSSEKSDVSESISIPKSSKTKLVAYVDRNPRMSKIMAKIIKASGYSLISETDPMRAIAMFLDSRPDIIFIDIELSGINGYELCSQLRQIDCFRETPIILFSRSINAIEQVKGKIAGCSELFCKSTESKSILNILNKYIPYSKVISNK
ncbi:MAG: response regulator [Xenococcaceae cyanobacterium MO_207.B15]|nr:response regulator [Xenococcaceae cyanobacterium MO_207.B15]